jgi:RNA polymerase sigma-70 factor (ECF subfamily)
MNDTPFLGPLAARHSDTLLKRIQRYIPDVDEAKDLLQDVWLQVLTKYHQFTGRGSLEGWTLQIARNTSLMALRRPARRLEMQVEAARRWTCWYGSGAHHRQPDVLAFESEFKHDFQMGLAQLSPGQRQAVTLRLLEGRSTAETAALMGCSQLAVKSYLHRAVLRLRKLLIHWRPESAPC